MKNFGKWLKFFGVTVASSAASAVLGTLNSHPEEITDYKAMANRAAAGAVVAALTLIVKNPFSDRDATNAEMRKSAELEQKTNPKGQ